jgi:hypothetical protein
MSSQMFQTFMNLMNSLSSEISYNSCIKRKENQYELSKSCVFYFHLALKSKLSLMKKGNPVLLHLLGELAFDP